MEEKKLVKWFLDAGIYGPSLPKVMSISEKPKSDDGKNYNIFGEGGVEKAANNYKKKFLGKIPLNIDLRIAADSGKPLVESNPDHKISKILSEIAKNIKQSFKA